MDDVKLISHYQYTSSSDIIKYSFVRSHCLLKKAERHVRVGALSCTGAQISSAAICSLSSATSAPMYCRLCCEASIVKSGSFTR